MKNPFYFGNEVTGDDFCNRTKELKELKSDVASGQNVLLYAPRRFGKTSLLKKLQNQLKTDDSYQVIYFDLFSVSTVDEFIQKYFNVIARSINQDNNKIINLFKSTLNLRPNINMTIDNHGNMNYSLSFSKKEQEITLEEVINLPYQYAKKLDKKIVVIFDEFQELEQFSIEKKLRSIIQTHGRVVSYLFCGSKKSIITQMFNDNKRAFYKSVKHLHINEINLNDWNVFILSKFTKTNKEISKKQIKEIYDITKGFPYYMQQLMSIIWENSEKQVTKNIINYSIETMIQREYDMYSYIWSSLTPNQKLTLKYIIDNDGLNIYTKENLENYDIASSTLKSTVEALIKKDVFDKKGEQYYLVDPFMEIWIGYI